MTIWSDQLEKLLSISSLCVFIDQFIYNNQISRSCSSSGLDSHCSSKCFYNHRCKTVLIHL